MSIHDNTVDRTTDGKGKISDMTWAELQKLDAGFRFTTDQGKTFPYRGKGLRIPRLKELLKRYGDKPLSIEIKQHSPPIVDAVMTQLEGAGAVQRTVIASFLDPTIHAVRKRNPKARTALALVEMGVFAALSDEEEKTYKAPGAFIQGPQANTDKELVERAHRLGLKVHPWTVNDPAAMKQLIAIGVDGMFTDDPKTLAGLAPAK